MAFEFSTAGRIVFGRGAFGQLGDLASRMGSRAVVVTGGSPERAEPVFRRLAEEGIDSSLASITGEPTVEILTKTLKRAREYNPDLVIGFGGGSAMDTAKAVSALIHNKGSVLEYLEVIGKGRVSSRELGCSIRGY